MKHIEFALERALSNVKSAPNGDRNRTLAREAFTFAGVCAGESINHDNYFQNFMDIVDTWEPEEKIKSQNTIRYNFKKGSLKPLPPWEDEKNFSSNSKPKKNPIGETTHTLTLPDGTIVKKVRYDYADAPKSFAWFVNGKQGLNGLKVPDLPLFEFGKDSKDSRVFLAEGCKSAAAITEKFGLHSYAWDSKDNIPNLQILKPLIEKKTVIIWADNDPDGGGFKAAQKIKNLIISYADEVTIITTGNPTKQDAADFAGTLEDLETIIQEARPKSIFKSENDFDGDCPEIEYLIQDLVPRQSLVIVTGPPKDARKTTLVSLLAETVSGGLEFMKKKCNPGKVLYIAAEESDQPTRKRLRKIRNGLLEPIETENLIKQNLLWTCTFDAFLDEDEGQEKLEAEVKRHKPSLLIIDPFTRVFLGDENNRKDVEPVLTYLKRLAKQYNLAVCIVHHAGKSSTSNANPDTMLRGSSAFRGAHDVLICSSPLEAGKNLLFFELRYAECFKKVVSIKFVEVTDTIEFEFEDPESQQCRENAVIKIFKALNNEPQGLNTKTLSTRTKIDGTRLKKLLLSLVNSGELSLKQEGSSHIYTLKNSDTNETYVAY